LTLPLGSRPTARSFLKFCLYGRTTLKHVESTGGTREIALHTGTMDAVLKRAGSWLTAVPKKAQEVVLILRTIILEGRDRWGAGDKLVER
jgi:hypothetical protein